jgi:glutaredoxin-like protein NrdH
MCESTPVITVYTNPSCMGCEATKKYLTERNTKFETVDLSTNKMALAAVKDLGYRQAPVVFVRYPGGSESHWAGFRPDKLSGFVNVAKKWERE